MAETTTATRTGSGRRTPGTRAGTKKAAPKPQPKVAAPTAEEAVEAVAEAAEGIDNVSTVQLLPFEGGPTKNYSRWTAPEGTGFTGTIYGPLNATSLAVIVGTD